MKKRIVALMMTAIMAVGTCCACSSSNTADTASDKGASVSVADESSKEKMTDADVDTDSESSLVKLEAVDESEVVDLGLSEEQLEEAFAFAAYNISENYFKPNDLTAESSKWTELSGWNVPYDTLMSLFGVEMSISGLSYEEVVEQAMNGLGDGGFFNLLDKSLFEYCYCVQNYDFENNYVMVDRDYAKFENLVMERLTFSDEQLALGEDVAQELSKVVEE